MTELALKQDVAREYHSIYNVYKIDDQFVLTRDEISGQERVHF